MFESILCKRYNGVVKLREHKTEYWNELKRNYYFWIAIILILSYFFFENVLIAFLGLILLIVIKYRVVGRLEERHGSNNKEGVEN